MGRREMPRPAHLGDEIRRFLGVTLKRFKVHVDAAESGNETGIPLKVVHESVELVAAGARQSDIRPSARQFSLFARGQAVHIRKVGSDVDTIFLHCLLERIEVAVVVGYPARVVCYVS